MYSKVRTNHIFLTLRVPLHIKHVTVSSEEVLLLLLFMIIDCGACICGIIGGIPVDIGAIYKINQLKLLVQRMGQHMMEQHMMEQDCWH